MNGFAAGRIAGIPIVFHSSFVMLALLYTLPFLRNVTPESIIVGVLVVTGGVGSVLLHELAHAFAARACGVRPLYIELNGLGGACYFSRDAQARSHRIFILLAGPAANIALLFVFTILSHGALTLASLYDLPDEDAIPGGMYRLAGALYMAAIMLSSLNLGLAIFNLLPSFPLDGGKALAEFLSGRFDLAFATRVVGGLGYAVCAWCAWRGLVSQSFWILFLAWSLFSANQQALDTFGRRRWSRWN